MHASSLISFTQRRSRLHAWWRRLRHERKESSSHAWGTNQSFARYDDDSRPAWPVIEITRQLRVSDRIRVSLLQVSVEDLRIPPAGPALGKQCIAWCLLTRRLVQWTCTTTIRYDACRLQAEALTRTFWSFLGMPALVNGLLYCSTRTCMHYSASYSFWTCPTFCFCNDQGRSIIRSSICVVEQECPSCTQIKISGRSTDLIWLATCIVHEKNGSCV